MSKHCNEINGTPGPWEVESGMIQTAYEHDCRILGCRVHIPIAYMDRNPGNGTLPCERDANARIIVGAVNFLRAFERSFGPIIDKDEDYPGTQAVEDIAQILRDVRRILYGV